MGNHIFSLNLCDAKLLLVEVIVLVFLKVELTDNWVVTDGGTCIMVSFSRYVLA